MKFAKYLEDNAIPEWKQAYLDYKKGKKLIKRVADALPHDRNGRSRTYSNDGSTASTPLVSHINRFGASPRYGTTPIRDRDTSVIIGSPNSEHGTRLEPSQSMATITLPDAIKPPTSTARHRTASVSKPLSNGSTPSNNELTHEISRVEEAQSTFFVFIQEQIMKVNKFYSEREAEASKRLSELRFQLHEMKDRKRKMGSRRMQTAAERERLARSDYTRPVTWLTANVRTIFNYADTDLLANHPMNDNTDNETAAQLGLQYRIARRRLKVASQEFYQSLEMLRSYRTLNRTALVKVMKKYDKSVHTEAGSAIIRSFDQDFYIGTSDFLEKIMHRAEDFYAKYYFHGDRKHAVAALRAKPHTEDYRFTMLRVGLYFGLSVPLAMEGLIRSQLQELGSEIRVFLLQVWGAFFFLILISLLFGLNCYIWSKNKINYTFIFEYDIRHNLTWMQYLELPGIITLLFSITFWMCFSDFFPAFQTWYPLLFVACCAVVLFIPIPVLHLSTRRWLITAHGRLLASGISSVRFQDVFLGDLYNSLTYSVGNIALFFCLYRWNWHQPAQCGSGRSILLGFFTTTPGIIRLFQCFRRYGDTKHYFPHLINAGKYTVTILQYTSLSLWRIHKDERFKILFIIFASINSIYTSTWDLVMDVSLLQPHSSTPLLRDARAFSWTWVYYVFLFLDPILRCSWIFYIIYEHDIQHAAALSFYIGLAEVFRRTMWSAFRVENEHVANVSAYRASRTLPLPFAAHTPEDLESFQRKSGHHSKTRGERPKVSEAHATDFSRKNTDDSIVAMAEDETSEASDYEVSESIHETDGEHED